MEEKGSNRLVPDSDYMVVALKLTYQAPRVTGCFCACSRRGVECIEYQVVSRHLGYEEDNIQPRLGDEALFWLNGYVNKQNCSIWSEANPQVYVETPLHPEKLTVWCALWAGGIIGPYFFKNDEGHNVTVNGDRYRAMITNFFIPELNNHDVQEL
ncbi:hypothetical protein TNCV_1053871 [Trichonephila clavipes]|nr:hypothetical protein TNCV_1053871 [Trichonephila clavipes]